MQETIFVCFLFENYTIVAGLTILSKCHTHTHRLCSRT